MNGIGSALGSWEMGLGRQVGLQIGVVLLWLGLVGAIATTIQHCTPQASELIRKVVHIGTGNIILFAWWLQIPAWMGIGASLIFSLITLLSYILPILPGINSVGRRSLGTFFYAVSIGLLIAGFWPRQLPQFAALGILIMTWGDGLAGLIGKTWGRHRYQLWGMEKSWEGSGTMALVSYGLTLAILLTTVQGPLWILGLCAALVAVTATTLEAFSTLGLDNLTVPLGTALLAWGLVQGLGLSASYYPF